VYPSFLNSLRFRQYAVLAVLVVLFITIGVAGVIVSERLAAQQAAVNYAARQRSTSYLLANLARQLEDINNTEERESAISLFTQTIDDFDNVQQALRNGDDALNLDPITNSEALAVLDELDSRWEDYRRILIDYASDELRGDHTEHQMTLDAIYSRSTTVFTYADRVVNALIALTQIEQDNTRNTILFVSILLGVVALTYIALTIQINSAIGKLGATATAFAKGDYTVRAPMHTFNEIARVSEVFNSMAYSVQNRETELKQFNAILEQRVQERTAELQSSNDELRIATARAREAARVKSEFLANVSHELRTPLNAIIGFSDMLLVGMSGPLNEKQQHKVERLKENGNRLLNLINDLLDLTRIEAGRMELTNSAFSPRDMAARIGAQMESLAQEKKLQFETKIDPTLPQMVMGDEKRLEQVVVNLLSNAFKFTREGSVSLVLDVVDSNWRLTVKDTGIGIPPHALSIIFEEFRQVDGTYARAYKGSGLGLSITRNIVRMMNGKITVDSVLEQGSTFVVELPLVLPEAAQLQVQNS
jgi:signal transduction histidine kinase